MSKADELAEALVASNDELIAFALSRSDEQWNTLVPDQQRTVGVLIHHCAVGHLQLCNWIRDMLATGETAGSPAALDEVNARHASEFSGVTVSETIDLLRTNGAEAAAYIRLLSDSELDTEGKNGNADGRSFTMEAWAGAAGRHGQTHLQHAREALGLIPAE